jgi:hypothetical protein
LDEAKDGETLDDGPEVELVDVSRYLSCNLRNCSIEVLTPPSSSCCCCLCSGIFATVGMLMEDSKGKKDDGKGATRKDCGIVPS